MKIKTSNCSCYKIVLFNWHRTPTTVTCSIFKMTDTSIKSRVTDRRCWNKGTNLTHVLRGLNFNLSSYSRQMICKLTSAIPTKQPHKFILLSLLILPWKKKLLHLARKCDFVGQKKLNRLLVRR